jgi:uncharacterized protein (TIGR02588 family)
MAEKKKIKTEKPPFWEWGVAAVGVLLVGLAIGTALYRAVTLEAKPPDFEITVESIKPTSNGYVVNFRAKNSGNQTAAAVNIEANLEQAGQSIETSTATLTYVPSGSERLGGLFFTKDPNQHIIKIRALGYEKP